MIRPDTEVILSSGDAIDARTVFEALNRLAEAETLFPLIDKSDRAKAVIAVAFEAVDWFEQGEGA